jgi:hypothetical protein
VAADVADTDTSITVVSNTPLVDLPADSVIIIPDINYVDVMGQIYSGTFTGIEGWTPSLNTASPNNTVNASRMLASGGSTNQDAVIQPKGTGALLARLPDGTATGGNKRGQGAVDLQTYSFVNDEVASGSYSVISGGSQNKSTDSWSVVSGGLSNVSSNDNTVVSGGESNTASAEYSLVAGGQSNTASGQHSSVLGGLENLSSGTNSVVIGGKYGIANKTGMHAYSSSKFAANGDNQSEIYPLSSITTDDTPTILTADNAAPDSTNTIAIESGACYTYEVKAIGKDVATGDIISHVEAGWVKNIGGTITKNKHYGYTDNELTTADLVVKDNDTDDRLDIEVTGESGKTIRWGATVTMRKVK